MRLSFKTITTCILLGFATASIQAQTYTITDFGAKADKNINNAAAIQKAIDKATIAGGTVLIPAGVFMSGAIQLKSNVTLQLNKNAVLKGIADRTAYPSYPITHKLHSVSGQSGHALIYASRAQQITITGEGKIDGNGEDPVFDTKDNMNTMRPFGLLIESCQNVTISGIRMENSAMWMQRYINCDFLRMTGVTVFNHANINNDGVDIDDCHNVIISDCVIDADDDALCFKSEGDRGVKNVVVTNCILATHASAFKFGTGSTGGFESVQFSNTVIRQSLASNMKHPFKQKSGLTGIDIASVDGGLVRDINIYNISIDSLENPIFMKLGNRMRRTAATPAKKMGAIEGIHFSQISIKNAGPSPVTLTGFPENYITDISFRDIFIEHRGSGTAKDTSLVVPENADQYPGTRVFRRTLPASAFYIRHVKNISFHTVQLGFIGHDERAAFVFDDVEGLEFTGLKYRTLSPVPHIMVLKDSKSAVISFSPLSPGKVQQLNSSGIILNK
ncbi:glycoside hydrolase family 28 protein [Pedobacter sp. AW31-3R]|uniref:glycoside hydrolase family 28 protein n=1 Tax=Pedobacter sp. AW31-3R TaxID=3445781 RepID=UPI003F9FF685